MASDAGGRGADGDVRLVVAVGGRQQRLADVGLALVVLLDDGELATRHRHRAAGGVVQAHREAGLRLLAVGLERAGAAVDVGDADLALALREGGGRGEQECERSGAGGDERHGSVSSGRLGRHGGNARATGHKP
jgi:hypothetical protein